MTIVESSEPDLAEATLRSTAAVFRSLGEPSRLRIVEHLRLGPHRVVDLVEHLGLSQSTVSAHLACLRDCGLVSSTPQGRSSLFALVTDVPLDAVLAAAQQVLVATGNASDTCQVTADVEKAN